MKVQKYPERHWMYESSEAEQEPFPSFMNDGYAPPDWELIQQLNEDVEEMRSDA